MGLGRDLRRARSLSFRTWADLATAAAELGLARIRLAGWPAGELTRNAMITPQTKCLDDERAINRVAFAIPRMGARVPWKGTCLVQALAAQRWLARLGISSEIVLGARKTGGSGLDAHAWLVAGGRTIVGGDVEGYEPFRPSHRR
jgi:hypothetical protein